MTSPEKEPSNEQINQLLADIRELQNDRSRHDERIMQIATQSGEIMTRLTQQAQQVIQSNEQLVAHINQLPKHVLDVVYKAVDQRMAQLGTEASRQVTQGVDGPLKNFAQSVNSMHAPVVSETQSLTQAFYKLRESTNGLFNKMRWTVGGSLAVLVLGSVGLLYHYQSVIRQNKMQADWVQALNQSDLSLCGDVICAKTLDAKGKPQMVKVERR